MDLLSKEYHPCNAEFTLLFFCEMNCRNSRRFVFLLADFLKAVLLHQIQNDKDNDDDNDDDGDKNTIVQLILIPNDNITNMEKVSSSTILSHLQSETEYWHLGFDHKNRLAIIRYVLKLYVINNKHGRKS